MKNVPRAISFTILIIALGIVFTWAVASAAPTAVPVKSKGGGCTTGVVNRGYSNIACTGESDGGSKPCTGGGMTCGASYVKDSCTMNNNLTELFINSSGKQAWKEYTCKTACIPNPGGNGAYCT